jgi:hypothetical protein
MWLIGSAFDQVMKAWRPSMWLPIIMIAWGAVMIGMGELECDIGRMSQL